MKKTIIALLALAGAASAEVYELDLKTVKFGDATTLTESNQAMTWDGTEVYQTWYMEFTLPVVTASDYKAPITTGPGGNNSSGLSVSAKTGSITLGKANAGIIDSDVSLAFSTSDSLTFAYYNGVAYLGNKTTEQYISISSGLPTSTAMTSGTSRAWANGNPGSTQIGTTSIASLDEIDIPDGYTLDMRTLMTKGVAQSVPEPTTATLSLLALAGLAMRRRRK